MKVLATIKDLTGWNDQDLADMIGMSRVTVNRVLRGHIDEHLSSSAKEVLRGVLADYIAELDKVVTYIEMTS